jgi:hypothetical protein
VSTPPGRRRGRRREAFRRLVVGVHGANSCLANRWALAPGERRRDDWEIVLKRFVQHPNSVRARFARLSTRSATPRSGAKGDSFVTSARGADRNCGELARKSRPAEVGPNHRARPAPSRSPPMPAWETRRTQTVDHRSFAAGPSSRAKNSSSLKSRFNFA